MSRDTLNAYYLLAKPGIVYGNAVAAVGGFFLASKGHPDYALFAASLGGICLVMASACVANNLIDRDMDGLMARTRKRALVQGTVSEWQAAAYAVLLGAAGTLLLGRYADWPALVAALAGFFVYVLAYTPLKRASVHATLVGSLAGAVPPVVGYCAVSGRFDGGALLLFLAMAFWQMPHFYAIALYRSHDYAEAGIPVLPLVRGMPAAKRQILAYAAAYAAAAGLLTAFGYTGYAYLAVMLPLSLVWLRLCLRGFRPDAKDAPWARRVFKFSLVVMVAFSVMISVSPLLP